MEDKGVGKDVAQQPREGRLAARRAAADADDDGLAVLHWASPRASGGLYMQVVEHASSFKLSSVTRRPEPVKIRRFARGSRQ